MLQCGDKQSPALDGRVVSQVSLPQDYCVTLEKIVYDGDHADIRQGNVDDPSSQLLGPKLYGRVCAAPSEDDYILIEDLEVQDRTQNCKDFFSVRDDDPVNGWGLTINELGSLLQSYLPDKLASLPEDDLVAMYRGDSDAPGVLLDRTRYENEEIEYATVVNVSRTIRLEDRRNHRIIFVFMPIFEETDSFCALTNDPVFKPVKSEDGFDTAEDLPGIDQVLDRHFDANPRLPVRRSYTMSTDGTCVGAVPFGGPSGSATFVFKIERNACANETVGTNTPRPSTIPSPENPGTTTPTPENPDTTPPGEEVTPPSTTYNHSDPALSNYCVRLNSATPSTPSGYSWERNASSSPDPELYGRVCATSSNDPALQNGSEILDKLQNCQDLWFKKDDIDLYFTSSTELFFANLGGENSREVTIRDLYRDARTPSNTVTVGVENNSSDIMLVFLPIVDADSLEPNEDIGDDLLDPRDELESFTNTSYPAVIRIPASEVNDDGGSLTKQANFGFTDSFNEGGNLNFSFEVTTGSCP